jgi:hypothetical protein
LNSSEAQHHGSYTTYASPASSERRGLRPKRLPRYIPTEAILVEHLQHEERREEEKNGPTPAFRCAALIRTRTSRTFRQRRNLETDPKNIFVLHAFKRSETSTAVRDVGSLNNLLGPSHSIATFRRTCRSSTLLQE